MRSLRLQRVGAKRSDLIWLASGLLWLLPAFWALVGPMPQLGGYSGGQVRNYLLDFAARALVMWAGVGFAMRYSRRTTLSEFFHRHVGPASPQSLALARVVVSGILLTSTLWEDLPSSAVLPSVMRDPPGVMKLVALLGEGWMDSATALGAYQALTATLLAMALLGAGSRVTIPLAALSYLILGGLFRQYAWAYHTGLIPTYVLAMLSLGGSADVWSVDAFWAKCRGRTPARMSDTAYGWRRYTLLLVIVVPYVEAGLSKLCNGGLLWWEPVRMRSIFYMDSLNPMEFTFDGGLRLASAPDVVFALLGLSAVLGEVAMVLVLFSRRAQLWVPLMMISMHVGILFVQNILFFDLILLLTLPPLWWWMDARAQRPSVSGAPAAAPVAGPPRAVPVLLAVLAVAWTFGIEFYPVTGMQMYSHVEADGRVVYYRLVAVEGGQPSHEVHPEALIPALRDGRHRRVLRQCFQAEGRPACDAFLAVVRQQMAEEQGGEAPVLEAQRWEWDFAAHPDDPSYGHLAERHRVGPANAGSAPVARAWPRALGGDAQPGWLQ